MSASRVMKRWSPGAWTAAGVVGALLAGGFVASWLLRPVPERREVVRRLWARHGVERPNLLLVTLDTTRADRLGAYGYRGADTPHLDGLAERGVLFTQAASPAPLTLPAHASIMTGTYPTYHGVRVNGNTALSRAQTTLAETLAQAGYRTGAFVGAFVLDGRWGLDQGFSEYDDRFDLRKFDRLDLAGVQRPANEVVDAALAWLAERGPEPFFAWVHLYDPHTPYEPPEPFRSRYGSRGLAGLYDGEIAFADQQLGRILSWLRGEDLEGETVVVVLGDHGESLGSHGEASHGYYVYDYALHVPLLVSVPLEGLRGVRVDSQVSSVDVLPTVLELLGLQAPEPIHGRSLVPAMLDPDGEREGVAYGESMAPRLQFGWSSLHSLRTTRYKLIRAPRPELYDLREDPDERTDVIAHEPLVAERLMARLDRLMAETARGAPEPESADLDRETLEGLAALGYVGGPVAAPDADASRPLADPKDKLEVFNAVQRAGELLGESDYAAAAEILEPALREEPRMPQARLMLGSAYSELGRAEEAKGQFDAVLKDDPQSVQALIGMANLLMGEGRGDDVIALCRRTLSLDERNTQAHVLLGEVYIGRGQPGQALPHFEQAVEIQPKLTQNRLNLAGALIDVGERDRAHELLRRIIAEYPRFPHAHFNLGLLLEERDRPLEARAAYEAEIAAYPDHYKARFNLAEILLRLGDLDGARGQLREVIRIAPGRAEGHLLLARSLLSEPAALDEVEGLVEKGLSLADTREMKALGWLLMADVYSRRREPDRMSEALAKARRYVPVTDTEEHHATRDP